MTASELFYCATDHVNIANTLDTLGKAQERAAENRKIALELYERALSRLNDNEVQAKVMTLFMMTDLARNLDRYELAEGYINYAHELNDTRVTLPGRHRDRIVSLSTESRFTEWLTKTVSESPQGLDAALDEASIIIAALDKPLLRARHEAVSVELDSLKATLEGLSRDDKRIKAHVTHLEQERELIIARLSEP